MGIPEVPRDGPLHVETLVIGGGQSGLATGYHLKRHGVRFLILDAAERAGDAWRDRWDSLRLFTPARYSSLPGMPFPAAPSYFPTKDEMADYLQAYASAFELPIVHGTFVRRLRRVGPAYEAVTEEATYTADSVVLATGMYRTPRIPGLAASLDPEILQLHSSRYRNPGQLPAGPVLVVGAGNSGAEIALELAHTRRTWLAGPDTGQEPTRAGSLPDRLLTPLLWFVASRVLTSGSPLGRKARDHFLHPPHGIPLARVRRQDLSAAGVERVARVTGVRDGQPVVGDAQALQVDTVIWCTGYDIDLSWVDFPLAGRDGYPDNNRGVITGQPGLYIMGLAFQTALTSAFVGGVGRDADHVTSVIATRSAAGHTTSATLRPR